MGYGYRWSLLAIHCMVKMQSAIKDKQSLYAKFKNQLTRTNLDNIQQCNEVSLKPRKFSEFIVITQVNGNYTDLSTTNNEKPKKKSFLFFEKFLFSGLVEKRFFA